MNESEYDPELHVMVMPPPVMFYPSDGRDPYRMNAATGWPKSRPASDPPPPGEMVLGHSAEFGWCEVGTGWPEDGSGPVWWWYNDEDGSRSLHDIDKWLPLPPE
mgnify:CR=1 FL=1